MKYEQLIKLVGERVKEKREELGITQEQLAKRMNEKKYKSTISKLENGKTQNPTLKNICDVANALDVEVWELMVPLGIKNKDESYPTALQDFINSINVDIKKEELEILKHLKIKGKHPELKEVYLIFWLMHRGLSQNDLAKLLGDQC